MKTFSFLRAGLLVLLTAATLTACKQNNDPQPESSDLAGRVTGQYTYASLTTGGKTYPADETSLKGGVTVTRQSETSVTMQFNIRSTATNQPFLDGSATDITLNEAGNGEVNFVHEGETVAKGGKNKLLINGVDDNDEEFTITLKK